ncbi:hypothetical protein CCR75_008570 [Bremia lactucae]|uniref:TLC domain-containing protein n=1 Tax=Bremia lactucae TaxID=4779 RepID=A0A976IDB2_BRELC|nr:hypothetical protein CCR75_008570 [Bremia lactucae]
MKMSLGAKEYGLIFMTLLLAPILVLELNGVFHERNTSEAFLSGTPGMPQYTDLLLSGVISSALIAVRFASANIFASLARVVLSPKKRLVKDRVDRFASVLFKLIYFVSITIVGFFVMQNEAWFPEYLGGKGSAIKTLLALSKAPPYALKIYFLVQLGYHLHSLIFMIAFSTIRNDFVEMLLHHVATILLMSGSYLSNYVAFGALVLFTHDIGDVFGYGIKSIVDTGNTPLVAMMYLLLLASWGYTRLYVLPYHLIFSAVVVVSQDIIDGTFAKPMIAMLCMLMVLHVYWYILFLVMGYILLKKGVAEDIQQKLEESDEVNDVSTTVTHLKNA